MLRYQMRQPQRLHNDQVNRLRHHKGNERPGTFYQDSLKYHRDISCTLYLLCRQRLMRIQ